MSTPLRLGTASILAFTFALGGCASSGQRNISSFGDLKSSNIALATRAQAALQANDFATAIDLAERAVDKSPRDVGFRALLGNAYFAAGRFASAEAAYKDSIALMPQAQVLLKLALVQIAQGKNAEARSLLEASRNVLDPADYGLAVALSGSAPEAVAFLDEVARRPGADARVRQNLALSVALTGDWGGARTIASQDVPADQLDARIQQWMAFASPKNASDQVASLVGVTPAAADPGQPTRLALNDPGQRQAAVTPPADAQPVQLAEATPAPVAPVVEPVAPLAEAPAPVVTDAEPVAVQAAAEPAPAFVAPKPRAKKLSASASMKLPAPRKAALIKGGNSTAVVQLGAYGSQQRVAAAWAKAAKRYGILKDYQPMSARFDSTKGTVYRLSVKGFANAREAQTLCGVVRQSGGNCFVRSVAGDSPVRMASR